MTAPPSGEVGPNYARYCPLDDHPQLKTEVYNASTEKSVGWKQYVPFVGPAISEAGYGFNFTHSPAGDLDEQLEKANILLNGSPGQRGEVARWRSLLSQDAEANSQLSKDLMSVIENNVKSMVSTKIYALKEWQILTGVYVIALGVVLAFVVFYYR